MILVRLTHFANDQKVTYLSDLQFPCLADIGIWAERSGKQPGQGLEIHLESNSVSSGSSEWG